MPESWMLMKENGAKCQRRVRHVTCTEQIWLLPCLRPRSHCSVFVGIRFCCIEATRSHCPVFVQKRREKPPFLCVHTELPDNKNAAKNIRFCAFTLLRFCETHHQHVAVVVAFSKTSVFVRSHWSRAFSKTSVFVDIHFWQRFRKRPFLLRFVWISVNSFANTGVIFSLFMYKNGVVWTGLWRSYSLIFLALHCCIRQAPAHSLRRCLSRSDKWLQIHAKG